MKFNDNIMFLYPCLKSKPIDYKVSTINFLINQSIYKSQSDVVQIYFSHDIDSEYIKKLIGQKKISAYIKIFAPESNYFKYEKIIFINKNKYINLDGKKVFGKTYLNLVLIANKDIDDFYSDEFEFPNHYKVKEKDIVGFSNEIEVDITKEDLVNESINSIFTIKSNENYIGKNVKYEFESDKIVIIYPQLETYENIEKLIKKVNYIPFVYQTIVAPCLASAIMKIDDDQYKYYKWSKLLKIKLENTDTTNLTYEKAMMIVQQLLNNPFDKMLENFARMEEMYE